MIARRKASRFYVNDHLVMSAMEAVLYLIRQKHVVGVAFKHAV